MKTLFSFCLFLTLTVAGTGSAQANLSLPATRGLESSGVDDYVKLLRSGDLKGLADWLKTSGGFHQLSQYVKDQGNTDAKTVALGLSNQIFVEQQKNRADRYAFVLLQTMLEEAVMFSGVETAIFTSDSTQLTPAEWSRAARLRGVRVVPGDTIVQIGSSALSSAFIAHSQTFPGVASHSLLISKGGDNPEILEALIEDGTNYREAYQGELARFFVLSGRHESDRIRMAEETERFIKTMKIPKQPSSDISPLPYDSTMNPERKKDGFYFCTALVQEVHIRASVPYNPFRTDKLNWNWLTKQSVEWEVYQELDITADRVPAPGDALLNPDMAIRALVLDTAGLKKARRLRAVVDAFFDVLNSQPKLRYELIHAFHQIPPQEVKKAEVIAAFDRLAADPQMSKLIGASGQRSVADARDALNKSLPQTANMRQLSFFMLMNVVVQDRAAKVLREFEENTLKRHASPGELRAAATQMMISEISKLREALALVNKASTGMSR